MTKAMKRTPDRISALHGSVHLENVTILPGVLVDEIDIQVEDAAFDLSRRGFEARSGEGVVRISDGSLGRMVEATAGDSISEVHAMIAPDGISITGKVKVLIAHVGFKVVGLLEVDGETRLRFKVLSAFPAQSLIEGQLEHLNPLIDLADMNLPIRLVLADVALHDGVLELFVNL